MAGRPLCHHTLRLWRGPLAVMCRRRPQEGHPDYVAICLALTFSEAECMKNTSHSCNADNLTPVHRVVNALQQGKRQIPQYHHSALAHYAILSLRNVTACSAQQLNHTQAHTHKKMKQKHCKPSASRVPVAGLQGCAGGESSAMHCAARLCSTACGVF